MPKCAQLCSSSANSFPKFRKCDSAEHEMLSEFMPTIGLLLAVFVAKIREIALLSQEGSPNMAKSNILVLKI